MVSQIANAQSCVALSGCAKKVCELQTKLDNLKEPHAIARVQAALADTKANCSDSDVVSETKQKDMKHQMKMDDKIQDAQEDIAKAKVKKAKAQAEGKMDKVQKYQHKIEEKELKIKHIKADM